MLVWLGLGAKRLKRGASEISKAKQSKADQKMFAVLL